MSVLSVHPDAQLDSDCLVLPLQGGDSDQQVRERERRMEREREGGGEGRGESGGREIGEIGSEG